MPNCSWRSFSSTAKIHKFLGFSFADTYVDYFYPKYLECDKYKDLWKCFGDHLHYFTWTKPDKKGIEYQRLVYDALKYCKKDAHDIEITAKKGYIM